MPAMDHHIDIRGEIVRDLGVTVAGAELYMYIQAQKERGEGGRGMYESRRRGAFGAIYLLYMHLNVYSCLRNRRRPSLAKTSCGGAELHIYIYIYIYTHIYIYTSTPTRAQTERERGEE